MLTCTSCDACSVAIQSVGICILSFLEMIIKPFLTANSVCVLSVSGSSPSRTPCKSSTSLQEMMFTYPPDKMTETVSPVQVPGGSSYQRRRRASMQDALDHTKINARLYSAELPVSLRCLVAGSIYLPQLSHYILPDILIWVTTDDSSSPARVSATVCWDPGWRGCWWLCKKVIIIRMRIATTNTTTDISTLLSVCKWKWYT